MVGNTVVGSDPVPMVVSTARSDVATTIGIAALAYALCDVVHEALGHGVVALALEGVTIVSISTVALQTVGGGRALSAAGPLANVLAGVVCLWLFARRARIGHAGWFLWLFAALNLLNGTGYLIFSAALGGGDWGVVVAGWQPAWLVRLAMGIVGAVTYAMAIGVSAAILARVASANGLAREDLVRAIIASYVTGGALYLVASFFNPIGPSLILFSGLSSGFGAMAGLVLVARRAMPRMPEGGSSAVVSRSVPWIVAGALTGAAFVAVLGPGIRLRP